jgi:uncharacterized protein YndB with AHSA1/START domain
MARNVRHIAASREQVWAVLADGFAYKHWVVGTTDIRAVDAAWPQARTKLHYTVSLGLLRHEEHTEVVSVDPGRCLELEAHGWPLGSVSIRLELAGDGDTTTVTLVEHPARGAAAKLHNPAGDVLLKLRNVEALRRLDRLARAVPQA